MHATLQRSGLHGQLFGGSRLQNAAVGGDLSRNRTEKISLAFNTAHTRRGYTNPKSGRGGVGFAGPWWIANNAAARLGSQERTS